MKIQVLRDVTRPPLLNVYRRFDSRIAMVLDCLPLQLSRYSTPKSWWLPTSWLIDVRSQKTWIFKNIAVITRNVSSKHYCLLQILVAALLLVSCAAFVKRYPHPLNCRQYFLRIDNTFTLLTCPNNLVFDQYKQQCIVGPCTPPYIPLLNGNDCNQNTEGYYCNPPDRFTYCTHDGLKIINNAPCPNGKLCPGSPNSTPCGWYTCST